MGAIRRLAGSVGSGRRELAIILIALGAYNLVRALPWVTIARGIRNGKRIAALERRLGIDVEQRAQEFVLRHRLGMPVWNVLYLGSQIVVMPMTLALVHRYRREAWPSVRNLALIAWSGGLAWYAAQPTAPPRMVSDEAVDTVSETLLDLDSPFVRLTYNPVAAMPSMHVGMASLATWSLIRVSRSRWTTVLGVLYPAVVTVAVVVTGNHYVLDVVGGVAVAVPAYFVAKWVTPNWGPAPAPSA